MLDPEKYPDNEVLWVETERMEKVWAYNSRSWKGVMTRGKGARLNPEPAKAPWHRQLAQTKKAKLVQ